MSPARRNDLAATLVALVGLSIMTFAHRVWKRP